jgi:hypothetical protein
MKPYPVVKKKLKVGYDYRLNLETMMSVSGYTFS